MKNIKFTKEPYLVKSYFEGTYEYNGYVYTFTLKHVEDKNDAPEEIARITWIEYPHMAPDIPAIENEIINHFSKIKDNDSN